MLRLIGPFLSTNVQRSAQSNLCLCCQHMLKNPQSNLYPYCPHMLKVPPVWSGPLLSTYAQRSAVWPGPLLSTYAQRSAFWPVPFCPHMLKNPQSGLNLCCPHMLKHPQYGRGLCCLHTLKHLHSLIWAFTVCKYSKDLHCLIRAFALLLCLKIRTVWSRPLLSTYAQKSAVWFGHLLCVYVQIRSLKNAFAFRICSMIHTVLSGPLVPHIWSGPLTTYAKKLQSDLGLCCPHMLKDPHSQSGPLQSTHV